MNAKNAVIVIVLSSVIGVADSSFVPQSFASPATPAQDATQPAIAKRIGAIKAINGNAITLAQDSGPDVAVSVQPNARILRLAPGEKDLKNATPIQLQDLQVGDSIRARGQASDDGKSITALEIVVFPRSAVQAAGDQVRQDWLKRGIAGPVSAVDPAAGTVTISISSFAGKKTILVRTSKNTIIRRYAPESAKPEDAKVVTLQEVHVDDDLRARGNRSADGSELAAEEILTGVFPQFPAMIKSVDASAGTLTVQDLGSKKTVQLRITTDSQLHKIPTEMANVMAMRLKKAALPPGAPGAGASSGSPSSPGANGQGAPGGALSGGTGQRGGGMGGGGTPGAGTPGGARPGGGFDFQRQLDQTPAVALADLHKGDALYVLTTQGTPTDGGTVIKLFSGVEPILQAAPNAGQAMMLAPWSLGGAPGGDAGQQ